jgi:acyl carrier protein
MASDNNFQLDTIFRTIQAERAMELLDQAWRMQRSRVLIGELNDESRMALWLSHYPIQLAEAVTASLDALRARLARPADAGQTEKDPGYAAVKLLGSEHDAFSETEQRVAETCKAVLGFDEIDIYENFFEMGADSLMIRQIYQRLSKLYPESVVITDLFEFPTVHKLARHIEKRQAGADSESRASNRAAMEEHELNRMFDELDSGAIDMEQMLAKLGSKER